MRWMMIGLVAIVACQKRDAAPPASWEPETSCTTNDDCTTGATCCPSPCGGPVMNKKDVSKMQARVDAECTKEARSQCPQAGACQAHVIACLRSKCTFVAEGSPDWQLVKPQAPDAH
jgi:hypothetical protein